jgi:hypothetical protein
MSSSASVTPPSNPIVRKLLRLGRFIIFLCTAGWAYPHVCTEDMDLTKIQNDHMAKKT